VFLLVPKLRLGMRVPKLRFERPNGAYFVPGYAYPPFGAELRGRHSQAELGNE